MLILLPRIELIHPVTGRNSESKALPWNTGRGKGKLGQNKRVAWTYIHYQM